MCPYASSLLNLQGRHSQCVVHFLRNRPSLAVDLYSVKHGRVLDVKDHRRRLHAKVVGGTVLDGQLTRSGIDLLDLIL